MPHILTITAIYNYDVFFSRFSISLMTFIFMFSRIQLIGWMYQDFEVLSADWSA